MRISDWSSTCALPICRETDASKVALAWLVARLEYGGFTLLDCQFQTDHLASLGTIEIPRDDYLARLASALGEVAALGVADGVGVGAGTATGRSDEHTSELQSLMRISYAVFCLKKKQNVL